MGDLFWNKIAGVVIGTILAVMVIGVVAEIVFPEHGEEAEFAYPLDLASLGTGSGAAEAEPEIDLGTLLANASAEAGERIARRCVSCHTFEQGGANGTGPNLWNVVGADKAAHAGFGYSSALASMEGSWTYEALDAFIENPRGYVSGTNMSFAGLRNEEDRADLLAYMQTLSSDPVPFPAPAPVEVEETGGEDMAEGETAMPAEGEDGTVTEAPVLSEQEIESLAAAPGDEDLSEEPETADDENGEGEE